MNTDFKIENQLTSSSMLDSKIESLQKTAAYSKTFANLTDAEKIEYAKAARGFESMFMNMMLKEMKTGMLDKDEKEQSDFGFGSDVLDSYADLMLSDEISKSGKGIGIADMLYTYLTGGDKLKPTTYEASAQPVMQTKQPQKPVQMPAIPQETIEIGKSFMERLQGRLSNYDSIISQASQKFNVPENLIKSIIAAESAGRHDARSSAGAKGLMQLMDGTADNLGVHNSYNPFENIMGGTRYIKMMLDKFGGNVDHALAAYNAGPGNVQKYSGIPPFKETQAYVQKVKKYNQIFNRIENES